MDTKIIIFAKLLLLNIIVISLPACVSTGSKYISNDKYKYEFSPRAKPPQITKLSKKMLKKKGASLIATIVSSETYKTCYPGEKCSGISKTQNPLNDMLKEAHDKGADYVLINKNNDDSIETVYKDGKCIQTGTTQVLEHYNECIKIDKYGSCISTSSKSRWRNVEACVKRDKIKGAAYTKVTDIELWRIDPQINKEANFIAVLKSKNTKKLEKIINEGFKPNLPSVSTTNYLMVAISRHYYDGVKLLIDNGVKVELTDKELMALTKINNFKMIKLLLSSGLKKERLIDSVIREAAKNNNLGFFKAMMSNGIEVNHSIVITQLLSSGHTDTAKYFLNDLKKNTKSSKDYKYIISSYLYTATTKNNKEMIKLFVENGADLNYRIGSMAPLLFWLYYETKPIDLNLLKYFVKHGADINIQSSSNVTLLMRAVESKDYKVVNYLLKQGVDPNVRHHTKSYILTCCSALDIARHDKDMKMEKILLKYNAK